MFVVFGSWQLRVNTVGVDLVPGHGRPHTQGGQGGRQQEECGGHHGVTETVSAAAGARYLCSVPLMRFSDSPSPLTAPSPLAPSNSWRMNGRAGVRAVARAGGPGPPPGHLHTPGTQPPRGHLLLLLLMWHRGPPSPVVFLMSFILRLRAIECIYSV